MSLALVTSAIVVKGDAERVSLHSRLMQLLTRSKADVRSLRVVETLQLGGNRSVILMECAGQRFLVSAAKDCLSAPVAVQSAETPGAAR